MLLRTGGRCEGAIREARHAGVGGSVVCLLSDGWCRLQELTELSKGAPEGISAGPIGDNMLAWQASITGDVSLQALAFGMLRLCKAPSSCPARR